MDKYAGMNKVESTLSANDEIVRKKEKVHNDEWGSVIRGLWSGGNEGTVSVCDRKPEGGQK